MRNKELNPLYANGKLYGVETSDGKLTNTFSFDTWLRCEVQEILKANIIDWLTPVQFEILVKEVKLEFNEVDNPENIEVEEIVHFIFESSTLFKHTLGETV